MPGRANDIIESIVECEFSVCRLIVPQAKSIKPRGDDRVARGGLDFVARQLFDDELIIWFVFVEAADYVVAVSPCVRLVTIAFVAICFCEPD